MRGFIQIIPLTLLFAIGFAYKLVKNQPISRKFQLDATILDTLAKEGRFKNFLAAVDAAGLKDNFNEKGLTIFAPNDDAFKNIPDLDSMLKDKTQLKNTLLFHVHYGKLEPTRNGRTFDSGYIQPDGFAKQLTVKVASWTSYRWIVSGQENPAMLIDPKTLNQAGEVYAGITCDNGLLHQLSEVLVPYEGNQPPIVTAIGSRDIEKKATLQRGFKEGTEGFGYLGNDQTLPSASSGEAWKEGGNYGKKDFEYGDGKGGYKRNEKGGDLSSYYDKQASGRPNELEVTKKVREMRPEKAKPE